MQKEKCGAEKKSLFYGFQNRFSLTMHYVLYTEMLTRFHLSKINDYFINNDVRKNSIKIKVNTERYIYNARKQGSPRFM